jgi:hypothetical protein
MLDVGDGRSLQRGALGELGPLGELAAQKRSEFFRRAADIAIAQRLLGANAVETKKELSPSQNAGKLQALTQFHRQLRPFQ